MMCSFCIASRGIKSIGETLDEETKATFDNEKEFYNHLEMEHDLMIQRENETEEQAKERVEEKQKKTFGYVRIGSSTCLCPSCKANRGDFRDTIVNSLRG